MPSALYWLAALLLVLITAVLTLLLLNAITLRRLRKEIAESRRSDAAIEAKVTRFLATRGHPPEDSPPPPRHLRALRIFTAFGVLGALWRAHPWHVASTAAAVPVTGMALVLAVSPRPYEQALPDPPAPIEVPARTSPPSLSVLSAAPVAPKALPRRGTAPGRVPPTTGTTGLPLPTATSVLPPSMPITTSSPPAEGPPARTGDCLLHLRADPLLGLCVPTLGS